MKFVPLREYVKRHTQKVTAARLGMTQGYLSQSLRAGRPIYVTELQDGTAEAVELKLFGRASCPGDEVLVRLHDIGDRKFARRG